MTLPYADWMSVFGIWSDGYFQVNGVDLSDHVRDAVLDLSVTELEDNTHGDNVLKVKAGLEFWQIGVTFLQDFSAGSIDAVLKPLCAVGVSPFNFVIGASNADPSTELPWYKGNCILTRYSPLRGLHGTNLDSIATFQVVGELRRATSILDDQRLSPLVSSSRNSPKIYTSRKSPKVYTGWPG